MIGTREIVEDVGGVGEDGVVGVACHHVVAAREVVDVDGPVGDLELNGDIEGLLPLLLDGLGDWNTARSDVEPFLGSLKTKGLDL